MQSGGGSLGEGRSSGMWDRRGSLQCPHALSRTGTARAVVAAMRALVAAALRRFVVASLGWSALPAFAQEAPSGVVLEPVVVSAQRSRETAFAAPASISAVTRETIENAGPQVNLSEALRGVPGISVLNRQNYAQDVQLSIRGFGARSTFGIRGVRLIVDGIPATMPDGQGQASSIALSSAGRIEVLRGPLAQLYGNAAGGVIQVFTQDDATTRRPSAVSSTRAGRRT
jgi:iron complex outermembrane receptor protein